MPLSESTAVPSTYEWRDDVHVLPGGLDLHFGGRLDRVELAYRLAGAGGAPVVAVLGGISAGRNVFSLQPGAPGWWEDAIGPGRALDTDRYRVLGIDFLGGSHRTTGPAQGEVFPSVSAFDQAALLAALMFWVAGEVRLGRGVRLGYMAQEQETLPAGQSALQVIQAAAALTPPAFTAESKSHHSREK